MGDSQRFVVEGLETLAAQESMKRPARESRPFHCVLSHPEGNRYLFQAYHLLISDAGKQESPGCYQDVRSWLKSCTA